MANLPKPELTFDGAAPDCGRREISLPLPLPEMGDDFDWRLRDYDSFRLFMLEELAARFPERRRWTPADIEVVLVEALAAMLDQLSDMADRVAAEAYLETARRPETVYRLLKLIGYDAVQESDQTQGVDELLAAWAVNPEQMEAARLAGPRSVHRQQRMVTAEDYARRLEEHPLVLRANAWESWGGAWPILWIAVTLWNDAKLDHACQAELNNLIVKFHKRRGLPEPEPCCDLRFIDATDPENKTIGDFQKEFASKKTECAVLIVRAPNDEDKWTIAGFSDAGEFHTVVIDDPNDELSKTLKKKPVNESKIVELATSRLSRAHQTARAILDLYLQAYRMAGQQVVLQDAVPVGIDMKIAIVVKPNYFRSEVRQITEQALGLGPGGFFEPGRLRLGEDIHVGDIYQVLTGIAGVDRVSVNVFKRHGALYEDQATNGRIRLDRDEIAVCDNDPDRAARGSFHLHIAGGRKG